MSDIVIVAVISFIGTLVGTFSGILVNSKMTNYRLEQLEIKVDKHNQLIERTYILEGKMNEVEHDIRDLKGK